MLVGAAEEQRRPLLLGGVLLVAHSPTTARAALINFNQDRAGEDQQALRRTFDHFERWQTVRASLQLATFLVMLRALGAVSGSTLAD